MRTARGLMIALLVLVAPVERLFAQGTALVASSDLAYVDLDRLLELGVLKGVIVGQRPYSRREFARIVRTAREQQNNQSTRVRALNEEAAAFADGLLRRLEERFGGDDERIPAEPVISLWDGISLDYNQTDAARRGFLASYTQPLDATIDPLARRRLGQPPVRGQSINFELSQRIEPTEWLAIQARERVEGYRLRDSLAWKTRGEMLLLSARARVRNVAVTIGRQEATWAQTAGQGLFLASDAPALDQIMVSGEQPFMLPWFLRRLGPTQATLVLAQLGASAVRSHSMLLAYKVSVSPTNSVELGGTFMNHFGGDGARSSSVVDRVIDFLPFIDVFRRHNYTDSTQPLEVESDKLLGVDGRVRFERLGGVLVTGELLIDDFDVHKLSKLLNGLGSQTISVVVPEIASPALSLQLTAKHMGILTYTHSTYLSGITSRGRFLGDELGPDAKSFGAQLRLETSSAVRFELEGRSAIYSNANYRAYFADAAQVQYVIQKVSHTADELRDIGMLSVIISGDGASAITLRGGGQRIRNASFSGATRRDFVAEIAIRIAQ